MKPQRNTLCSLWLNFNKTYLNYKREIMKELTRRNFLGKTLAMGAGLSSLTLVKNTKLNAALRTTKDDISLAEWALVKEIRAGKWTNSDFPRIAKEDFGINGIEFVNTLFEVPTYGYLQRLKRNADNLGVKMVLIMVDSEGATAAPTKAERIQTVTNHKKWIDIATYLGCHAIRTNWYGPKDASNEDMINYAEETYNLMLEYSVPRKISILIENHGGISDDPDAMITLQKRVNSLYFGLLPDWREPGGKFDNVERVRRFLPYSHGQSVRYQPTEEATIKMIEMCRDGGYRGFYGIETSGREGIKRTKEVLDKVLFGK